jgi:FlaA1/EpsC-like NDP-sugar epimerase
VWEYTSLLDLARIALAVVAAVMVMALMLLLFPFPRPILSVYLFYTVLLFLGMAGARSSFAFLEHVYNRQRPRPEEERILLYGAGNSSESVLYWLLHSPGLNLRPVGLLDEDPRLLGRAIHGIAIMGGSAKLEDILAEQQINGLVFASPAFLSGQAAEKVLEVCRQHGVWVRVLRMELEEV